MKQKLIKRPYYLDKLLACRDSDFVKILVGVRRSGKSTILRMFIDYLLAVGVTEECILTINYESLTFDALRSQATLHDYVKGKMPKGKRLYLFLDEVQEIPEWSKVVNSLRVTFDLDIYVTGSNSKVFAGEYLTYLAGRYIAIDVYPLSFFELGTFIKHNDDETLYRDYLTSTFPSAVTETYKDIKRMIVDDLYHCIFERDIILRGKIRNEESFLKVARFVYCNIGSAISVKRIRDTLNSEGRDISIDAIENYLTLMCNAYCLYQCRRYDIKGKEVLKTNGKYYTVDFGLRERLVPNIHTDSGHILENFVFLELIKSGYKVFIGKVGRDKEIDFIAIKGEQKMYIQVCESIVTPQVRERETNPFLQLHDNHPRYLVTLDKIIYQFEQCTHLNVFAFIRQLNNVTESQKL